MKKKTKIILIVLSACFVLLAVGGGLLASLSKNKQKFTFIEIAPMNLKEEVSSTGKVKAAQAVDLSFETGGKVSNIYIKVAEQVRQGDVLATLSNAELKANLLQYQANYQAEKAVLDELLRGTREEEIALAETKVENARINLQNAEDEARVDLANIYDDTPEILQTAYAKADDAVNKQIDDLFTNGSTANPKLSFQTTDSQAGIDAENQRILVGYALTGFKTVVDTVKNSQEDYDQALEKAEGYLNTTQSLLNTLSLTLNKAANLSETTLSTYKGYLNTARTNISQELTNINTQKQSILSQRTQNQTSIASSQNALAIAEDELAIKLAGSTKEQVEAQKAKVSSAIANIKSVEAKIEKTIIRAPFDGVITKLTTTEGEVIAANLAVISQISEAKFEIESNIPEIDIAKIKISDKARVTLDALGTDTSFEAIVSQIDLSETLIEGVATYQITLQFKEDDPRIRSGMTANLDILTKEKEGVLAVPTRAIIAQNGSKKVKILTDGNKTQEIAVEVGMRSSDGKTEIISGLKPGDKVITSY